MALGLSLKIIPFLVNFVLEIAENRCPESGISALKPYYSKGVRSTVGTGNRGCKVQVARGG